MLIQSQCNFTHGWTQVLKPVLFSINTVKATNVNHLCNFKYSTNYINKEKETAEINFPNIFYLVQNIQHIILTSNQYKKLLMRNFKSFIHTTFLKCSVILHLQHISIQTSCISHAQQPHGAGGYKIGQCRLKQCIRKISLALAHSAFLSVGLSIQPHLANSYLLSVFSFTHPYLW